MDAIINQLLRRMGITANYRGHRQLAMAIRLVLEDEDRLYAVQQEIYQPIADALHCNRDTIDRNIRTVLQRAWKHNRPQLNALAGYELTEQPKPVEFIDMLANRVRRAIAVR